MAQKDSNTESAATPFQNLVAGAGSGFLTRCVVAPLDVVKVRFQLQTTRGQFYRSIPHTFYRIARDEGPTALWKGNLLGTLMASPYTGIAMMTHKTMKKYAFSDSNSPLSNAISGASAGIVATGLTYPCDLLRSRFIAQRGQNGYTSIYHAVTTIYHHQGVRGIFEGITPALVGIVPYMAIQFLVYESLSEHFRDNDTAIRNWGKQVVDNFGEKINLPQTQKEKFLAWTGLDAISQSAENSDGNYPGGRSNVETVLSGPGNVTITPTSPIPLESAPTSPLQPTPSPHKLAPQQTPLVEKSTPLWAIPIVGLVSGTCGKAISFPMDLIKRRMQMNSFVHTFDQQARPTTTNMFKVANHIWKTEGFFAFYKGLAPALLKSGPSASLVFVFYEGILRMMRAADGNNIQGVGNGGVV